MMWEIVEQMVVKGFVGSNLYVTVEPTIVDAGEGSQHIILDGTVDEHIDSIPLQSYQGCAENTGDGYDDHGLGDDATHIDVTRDDFEELLDTMGEHEDVDHIEDVVVEENGDTCSGPDPTPEWFTKNTWNNMFDPSPVMQAEVSSWTPGEQPMKGMVFTTKFVVRHALTWYALRENFRFKTEHSDSERLMVSCEDDSSPWSVRAICCKGDNVWKIVKCKGPHTCNKIQNAHDGRMIDSVFLAYVLECYIREDPAYKIKSLRHVALADLKHEVSHYKVWDAKQKAITAIYGDFKESYVELQRFLAGLKDASPGTKYKLLVNNNYEPGTCTFKSVFWAFHPCIIGFKNCRPVITIDATHLYGKYKGKLMIAMATDTNNKIYPLAFAVVKSESVETWGWFLACIRRYVIDRRHLCVISDRHPGIQAIFRDTNRDYLQPPMTEHRYCLCHLCSNDAHQYLKDVPKEKWALTFDEGYRYGAMTTNVSECFNGVLKGARSLPITAMVKYTWFKLNAHFDDHRNKSIEQLNSGKKWCKYALDIFMRNKEKAEHHRMTKLSAQQQSYQVDTPHNPGTAGHGDHTHGVNLLQRTCTCQKWKSNKIPCSHDIAVCIRYRHDAEQYIDLCYSVDALFRSYAPIFPALKDRL
ncbi:uncharacterized protein LOC142634789 [Castanea sativa]|uniref:uncharacterized protein LOC142634789 n=1 Tax=Castanea sativa TaxID=21020 RepID=UPI003F64C0DA